MLVTASVGLGEIKNGKISTIILIYLLLCNLIIPNYFPLNKRDVDKGKFYYGYEQYIKENPDKNLHIIATMGGRFLKKYDKHHNIFDFDHEKFKGSNGREVIGLLFGEDIKNKATKENIKELITPYILNDKKHKNFENYLDVPC